MSIPECAENCGLDDAPSDLYVVTSELFGPGSPDYVDGVTYEFVRKETDRCVWERKTPGAFPWIIERLSRYPTGWAFFEIQPVPGVWTWRLSVDAPQFFLFHGWLRDLPRADQSVPDPLNNCSAEHELLTYVPGSLDGPVTITPVGEPIEIPRPGQRPDPCFCNSECPPGTKPYGKYLCHLIGDNIFGLENFKFLIEVVFEAPDNCSWLDVDLVIEHSGVMTKADKTPIPPAEHAYSWNCFVRNTLIPATETYELTLQWSFLQGPTLPRDARCDDSYVLPSVTNPTDRFCRIRPVPHWVCGSEEAADWDERYPLPVPLP